MRIEKHPILEFDRGEKISFTFDDKPMEGYAGETIASALVANGISRFRESILHARDRGFFCGIGRCCSCNVVVDGEPNVRACVTKLSRGMQIQTQFGKGDLQNDK